MLFAANRILNANLRAVHVTGANPNFVESWRYDVEYEIIEAQRIVNYSVADQSTLAGSYAVKFAFDDIFSHAIYGSSFSLVVWRAV